MYFEVELNFGDIFIFVVYFHRERPGGYNINGMGLCFLESIEGDLSNLRGVPIFKFCMELRKLLERTWVDTAQIISLKGFKEVTNQ